MNKVIDIKESREEKRKPFLEKLNKKFDQIDKLNEMLDRDISEMNKESTTFYFKQVFNELDNLKEIDKECAKEYTKAFNKEKKPAFELLDEGLRDAMAENYRESEKVTLVHQNPAIKELEEKLKSIEDTYEDFVGGILQYCKKKKSRLDAVLEYINLNPNCSSSDVVEFVSNQPDFKEDAAHPIRRE